MTTSHTIELTSHAVERFQERVRPALSREAAEAELAQVALVGNIIEVPPEWHRRSCAQLAPYYLEVADILLPLVPRGDSSVLVATTCLAKGSMTPEARRRRTARRRRAAGCRTAP